METTKRFVVMWVMWCSRMSGTVHLSRALWTRSQTVQWSERGSDAKQIIKQHELEGSMESNNWFCTGAPEYQTIDQNI